MARGRRRLILQSVQPQSQQERSAQAAHLIHAGTIHSLQFVDLQFPIDRAGGSQGMRVVPSHASGRGLLKNVHTAELAQRAKKNFEETRILRYDQKKTKSSK